MRTLWSTHARSPRQSKFLKASPPGPRRHNRSTRAADPTPSHTHRTPLFRPSTFVARLVHPTCPQTPRSQHSDSWPHPLTDTAHSGFPAAQLLRAWSTPPAPRCHDRSTRAAGPTPSQTPHTPVFTPPTFFAIFGSPTCPQRPRWQHSDIWPHPLTTTTNAAFDAAHLRCTPG